MAEEKETIAETKDAATDPIAEDVATDPQVDPVEAEPSDTGSAAPTEGAAPADSGDGTPNSRADVSEPAVNDLDAQLDAKESLADKLEKGDITYEEFTKQAAQIERKIVKAQREMAKPAQQVAQTIQEQKQAVAYWQNWGKGKDVAQDQYGKTVSAATAKKLYQQAIGEFEANPRYQRPEYGGKRGDTIIYEKFMDMLAEESTKKSNVTSRAPAGTNPSGTGRAASTTVSGSPNKTARQRLADGEYDLSELKNI